MGDSSGARVTQLVPSFYSGAVATTVNTASLGIMGKMLTVGENTEVSQYFLCTCLVLQIKPEGSSIKPNAKALLEC